MKKNKIIAVILAAMLTASLFTACNNSDTSSDTGSTASISSSAQSTEAGENTAETVNDSSYLQTLADNADLGNIKWDTATTGLEYTIKVRNDKITFTLPSTPKETSEKFYYYLEGENLKKSSEAPTEDPRNSEGPSACRRSQAPLPSGAMCGSPKNCPYPPSHRRQGES